MANSWFSKTLGSPLDPPISVGRLSRPPDPPDPASPSHFPSLTSARSSPSRRFSKAHLSQIPVPTTNSPSVPVLSSSLPSMITTPEVVSAAQLLTSYLSHSSTVFTSRSETATVATVLPSTIARSNHGILGATPKDYVILSSHPPQNLSSSGFPHQAKPPSVHVPPPVPGAAASTWSTKVKTTVDKSLKRLSPVSYSATGVPQVLIPDEVFQRGAELHKDFIVCRFFGRIPAYDLTQSVMNHMWGKGKHLEIHLSPAKNSVL